MPRQSVLNSGGKFLGEGLGLKSLKSKPDVYLGLCLGCHVYSETLGALKAKGSPMYPMTGQGWKEAAAGVAWFCLRFHLSRVSYVWCAEDVNILANGQRSSLGNSSSMLFKQRKGL